MRSLVCIALVAAVGICAGWLGADWIAPSDSQTVSAIPLAGSTKGTSGADGIADASDRSTPAKSTMATLAELCAQRSGLARDHAILAALDKLTAADFPAGAEEMLALLRESTFIRPNELADAWMDRWLQVDPRGALRFLNSSSFFAQLPTGNLAGWPMEDRAKCGLGGIVRALSRREPEWTRRAISDLKSAEQRAVAVYVLLDLTAEQNAATAEQFLASFAEGPDRRAALDGFVAGIVTKDVHVGFDVAIAEAPGPFRDDLIGRVFIQAGIQGMKQVRELLERVDDPGVRQKGAAAALASLGPEERADALPFIREESERMASNGGWHAASPEWASSVEYASRGPQARAFAEWAAGFTADTDRGLFAQIAQRWAKEDPAGVRAWLTEHATTLDRRAIGKLDGAIAGLVSRDRTSARAWCEALPPGPVKDFARFQIALGAGEESSAQQVAAAYEAVASTDSKGLLAGQIAQVLVRKDGAAAADWAMQQAPGPGRAAALQVVAEHWSASAPRAAAAWLEQIPAGPERDTMVQTYASKVVVADPRTAALWVDQVSDPTERMKAAKAVYSFWQFEDPIAARAWLRNLPGIEPNALAKLLR